MDPKRAPLLPGAHRREHEFLTFTLGVESFGVEARKVREVRGCEGVQRFDQPWGGFFDGMLTIEGSVVPVVDLHRLQEGRGPGPSPALLVVDLGDCQVGLMVDGVLGIVELAHEQAAHRLHDVGRLLGRDALPQSSTLH
jgi:purine-binding chemotaxis protein CheW